MSCLCLPEGSLFVQELILHHTWLEENSHDPVTWTMPLTTQGSCARVIGQVIKGGSQRSPHESTKGVESFSVERKSKSEYHERQSKSERERQTERERGSNAASPATKRVIECG